MIATLGSKEGLANLAAAITSPGDTILVPNPSYPIHQFGFIIAGASVRCDPGRRRTRTCCARWTARCGTRCRSRPR